MRRAVCIFLFLILIAGGSLIAQDVTISAGVDKSVVGLEGQIVLEITVSGTAQDLPEPVVPRIDGFNVYSAGRSMRTSIVNGAVEASVSYRFILTPQRTGKLTIPPQSIEYKGRKYSTDPIEVTVVNTSSSQSQRNSSQIQNNSQNRSSNDVGTNDFWVEAEVDKDTAYVNEQVTLTFRFYQGKRLHSSPDYDPPSATGFWVEDLPPQKNYYKTIRGRNYYVIQVKTALFPTAPGVKKVGKAYLKIKEDDLFSLFDRDPFGFFERKRASRKPIELETDPIEIVVLPLPETGKPENFSGSVGDFRMTTSIDKTEVEVNQPVTVTVKVSGEGNIKTLPEPEVPEVDDFRVFSSGKSENVSKAGYVVAGWRTFELTFVPKKPGKFKLPKISSNYFDPDKERYLVLDGREFEINVTGVSNEEIAAQNNVPRNRFDLVAKDIRYIVTGRKGTESWGGLYIHDTVFIGINTLFAAGLLAVWVVRRRQDKLEGDVGYRRQKRAVKMAKVRLSESRRLAGQDKREEFFAEISRALTEYVGDKFNTSAFGLTSEQIRELFDEKTVPDGLKVSYLEMLEACDRARFAPSADHQAEMNEMLDRAEKWIVQFEDVSK